MKRRPRSLQAVEGVEPDEKHLAAAACGLVSPVAVLGLAGKRDRVTWGPRPTSAREGKDVHLVPGLVLAAGDDTLADRSYRQPASSGA
jgi:hypothetical protein